MNNEEESNPQELIKKLEIVFNQLQTFDWQTLKSRIIAFEYMMKCVQERISKLEEIAGYTCEDEITKFCKDYESKLRELIDSQIRDNT